MKPNFPTTNQLRANKNLTLWCFYGAGESAGEGV